MKLKSLIISSGILNMLWGISHLIPTGNVVRDFGEISANNRHIITMEWINEGFTLIFIGVLIIVVTLIKTSDIKVKKAVYLLSAGMLIAMALLSVFTGFNVDFIPFKFCPFIFTVTAVPLIFAGLEKHPGKEKSNKA